MNVTDSTCGLRHCFGIRHLFSSVLGYDALAAQGLNGGILGTTFFEKILDATLPFLGKSVPPYDVRAPVHATDRFRKFPKIPLGSTPVAFF